MKTKSKLDEIVQNSDVIAKLAAIRGDFRLYMTRTQLECYNHIQSILNSGNIVFTYVIHCSRRWGKSYLCAMLVFRQAMLKPGSLIRYIAPTASMGEDFVIPAMDFVARLLPERLRPVYRVQQKMWVWGNGSKCLLGSAETKADADLQVGTPCDLAILDEASKIRPEVLTYLINSVLYAQLATTQGYILAASTPAETPAHSFSKLVKTAIAQKLCSEYTIDDVDHIEQHVKDKLIESMGGMDHPDVQRELYLNNDTNKERAIVPEFHTHYYEIVKPPVSPPPLHRDWYVIADFGYNDFTFVLFSWYDFDRRKLVCEAELVFEKQNGYVIGDAVRKKEIELGIQKPIRYADGNLQLLETIASKDPGPGIHFASVPKYDKDAALNNLRTHIQKLRIEINEVGCPQLIAHLREGIWNEKRTDFERIKGYGHFDGIDTLKYNVRVMNWNRNPEPTIPLGVNQYTHHISLSNGSQRRRMF